MNGVHNIPQGLKQTLDESRYVYNDENIVSPDDIVQVIDIE